MDSHLNAVKNRTSDKIDGKESNFMQLKNSQVWILDVVTLQESLITVLQFFLLLMHAYVQDKRWPYLSLPLVKWDRPLEWVPEEESCEEEIVNGYSEITQIGGIEEKGIIDIFSAHSETSTGLVYQVVLANEVGETSTEQF